MVSNGFSMPATDIPLKICVQGLWHLGCVTAACTAAAGHDVTGLDKDRTNITRLNSGNAPLFELGLDDLIQRMQAAGRLHFTNDPEGAVSSCDVLWICFDTPVDEDDRPDAAVVIGEIEAVVPRLSTGALVLVSAQLPVGTIAGLERFAAAHCPRLNLRFACCPENLRLGRAIEALTEADRFVIGTRGGSERQILERLFSPWQRPIEWMGIESAEMVKHTLNAYLGTTISFINEVAGLCEITGADAAEVRRGIAGDSRVGRNAPLSPGAAFAGGTLARDLRTLIDIGGRQTRPTTLLNAVIESNEAHKQWAARRLGELLGSVSGRRIGIWGLAYKAGTSALRRSPGIDLCRWLGRQGAIVTAHDPVVAELPASAPPMQLATDPLMAARNVDALIITTSWPEYRGLTADAVAAVMDGNLILDPGRSLAPEFADDDRFRYLTVGKP